MAQKVLQGKTKGYRFHPQLERFKNHPRPMAAIGKYLSAVCAEAAGRGYQFNAKKIFFPAGKIVPIKVTQGQIAYEFSHLKKKLKKRDVQRCKNVSKLRNIESHPVFKIVRGDIEPWEAIK